MILSPLFQGFTVLLARNIGVCRRMVVIQFKILKFSIILGLSVMLDVCCINTTLRVLGFRGS